MRFIHLADVHLGAVPDRGCPWSDKRENEIWETFRRVIAGIRENPVDLLFIAGDLFHRQPLPYELNEVNNLFSSIPNTSVYLMAGDSDYLKGDSFYREFSWAPNVTFFQEEKITCVKDTKSDVYVYGMSYEHPKIEAPVYDSVRLAGREGVHILLAHGGDGSHCPVNVAALAETGFDYIALGHLHTPQSLIRDVAAYSGTLEPVCSNDFGEHGYIEGRIENGKVRTRFVPFSMRTYNQLLINVNEGSTQLSVEDTLKDEIFRRGGLNIYRVILQGKRKPELFLIPEKLKSFGNITEVLDETRPAYDLESLQKRYAGTLIGDYIRFFQEKNRNTVEDKALYYGLQALLETRRSS